MDSWCLVVLERNGFQGTMGKGEDLEIFVEEHPSLGPLWWWGRNTAISRFHPALRSDLQCSVEDVLLGQGVMSVLATSVQESKIGEESICFSMEGWWQMDKNGSVVCGKTQAMR